MGDEHFTRASPIECRLISASMEIDDDDEDVIQVTVEVSNEAAMPMGGLDIFIQTSDNKKVESSEGISSLGPGLTRKFTFEFPLQSGNWTFMLRSSTVEADLGPYENDFTYQAQKGRVYNNAIGSGMFTDAFTGNLDDFGNIEERGLIDASSIKMTSYFGENSAGGSTAITAGSVPKEVENSKDAPRVPPWERANDALLSTPVASSNPEPAIPTEIDAPESDLLAFSKQVSGSSHMSTETPATAETPPQLPVQTENAVVEEPVVASTPPSLPPSEPPSKPPTGPPSGPPSSPPSGPPSKPPTGPPSGPPSSPPSGATSKPPTGPPSGPPSSPPNGPPSKPPTGPPSGPPSSPPKSKKPTRPPM